MNRIARWAGVGALALSLAGCGGMTYREQGTVVGAGVGAAAGAAITGDAGGAIGGGIIGGVIGHEVARDREERRGY
jgi:osmotically inducible lipoprotein OsmB